MTIKIIEEPDLHLTADEYNRYSDEYRTAFMFYSGTVPTFETFVRQKKGLPITWPTSNGTGSAGAEPK